jgi:hypothetical protein
MSALVIVLVCIAAACWAGGLASVLRVRRPLRAWGKPLEDEGMVIFVGHGLSWKGWRRLFDAAEEADQEAERQRRLARDGMVSVFRWSAAFLGAAGLLLALPRL